MKKSRLRHSGEKLSSCTRSSNWLLVSRNILLAVQNAKHVCFHQASIFFSWFQHLFFTGIIWYLLNQFYEFSRWKIVVLNMLLFIAHYFLWIGLLYLVFRFRFPLLVPADAPVASFNSFIRGSWFDIGKYVLKLTAFYAVKFYYEYRRAEKQRVQLALVNKDMQLNLLKQQLSPHFYFNTLNNLYGLARINSEKLPDALHQLSNIMQYVIVDCNQPRVLLSEEISFLQSYIALEKLRYEEDIIIEMKVDGDPGTYMIQPLMLIQFVENAFKHGMKEKSDRNWMKCELQIREADLLFTVENSYYENTIPPGIGINSVNDLLQLQYEGKHEMKMETGDHRFLVTLSMNLL